MPDGGDHRGGIELKLYAMSCGYLRCRKVAFVPTADKSIIMDSPMPVYLITHPHGNVLFDTGPNPVVFDDAVEHWGGLAKAFQPLGDKNSGIVAQLEKIGFHPRDVKYVVNSHLHFDHAGGNRFFPEATFIVQKSELECARNPEFADKGYIRVDWDDDNLHYDAIHGELDLYQDGTLRIIPMEGHSLGHHVLLVRLKNQGTVILSGDSVPCEENFLHSLVTRTNMDNDLALRSIGKLHQLVDSEAAILIHGHDPIQWEKLRKAPAYYD
jgi:N-acyl homoserine lactone hydrolase